MKPQPTSRTATLWPALLCAIVPTSCSLSPAVEGAACKNAADCAERLLCLGRVCRKDPDALDTPDAGSKCRADCTKKCDGLSDGCGGKCMQPCDWMKIPLGADNPPVPQYAAMVYDSQRERTVLLLSRENGVTETWERAGVAWEERNPRHFPPDDFTGYAMAYDETRQTAVLFGGRLPDGQGTVDMDDTWTWDGTDWHLETPLYRPSARSFPSMTYDQARGRVVLYGGCHIDDLALEWSCPTDTWEWTGDEWVMKLPKKAPPERIFQSMAYDPVRTKVVLYGGLNEPCVPNFANCYHLKDLWEWDGVEWVEIVPENPPEFAFPLATFDANGQTLTFYLCNVGSYYGSVGGMCTLTGQRFSNVETPEASIAGCGYGLSFDNSRNRLVLFGESNRRLNDTLEWDGTGWQLVEPRRAPSARAMANAVFDNARGVTVLVGGQGPRWPDPYDELQETWEWDGRVWRQSNPIERPPEAEWRAMVYDDVRRHVLLFNAGCHAEGGSCGETWTWDGNAWRRLVTANSPGARHDAAMAFDSARGRAVLFGGSGISGGINDAHTWEFDGEDWVVRRTPQNPPGRTGHAMAYDKRRDRVVMFGGESSETFRDTWEWDGDTWTKAADDGEPEGDFFFAMAYDSTRDRVLLHGSFLGRTDHDSMETWEWDGQSWRRLCPSNRPSAWYGFATAYDSWRDRLVLFGGSPGGGWNLDETWEFGAR